MSSFKQIVRHKRGSRSDFYDPGTPAHYPPDLELEPVHLDINLHVDIAEEQATGHVTTTVIARGNKPSILELDGIDFELCKKYGVRVAYTPDAPTMAVAELCLGMILDLARQITFTDKQIRQGIWKRHMGTLLYGKTVGIFGMGRIGKSLIHLLTPFNVKFLVHDIEPDIALGRLHKVQFCTKTEILKYSDVISVNIYCQISEVAL